MTKKTEDYKVKSAEILAQLAQPFPQSQIAHRNIQGREESWVPQHHLMERLNKVLGLDWDWTILDMKCENTQVGRREGQRCFVHGRLTIKVGERWIQRDGVGEKDMVGFEGARKAANSVAFRHACKFFTTFLWNGGVESELPSTLEKLGITKADVTLDSKEAIALKGKTLVEQGLMTGDEIKHLVEGTSSGRTSNFRELTDEECFKVLKSLDDELQGSKEFADA